MPLFIVYIEIYEVKRKQGSNSEDSILKNSRFLLAIAEDEANIHQTLDRDGMVTAVEFSCDGRLVTVRSHPGHRIERRLKNRPGEGACHGICQKGGSTEGT